MAKRIFAVLLTLGLIFSVGFVAMQRNDISLSALEKLYAFPDSRYVSLNGQDVGMHFRDVGDKSADTIILIHGYSASVHTWNGLVDTLASQYRVIAIDLPGHGLTRGPAVASQVNIVYYVDILEQFLTKLNIEKPTLIGSSMGGNVSWAFAQKFPDRINGLVLIGASGIAATEAEKKSQPFIFTLLKNPWIANQLKNLDMTQFIRSGLNDSFVNKSFVTKHMVERYSNFSRGEGHRPILLNLQANPRDDFDYALLAGMTTPALIIHGDQDKLVPLRIGQTLHDTLPNSELYILENIGHLPHEEATPKTLNILGGFLEKLSTAPTPEPGLTTQPLEAVARETIE